MDDLGLFSAVVFLVFPIFNLLVGRTARPHLHLLVTLLGKIMCYAIVAVARTSFGATRHPFARACLFFALGGYSFGMYLMRQIGSDGQYRQPMPDFMVFLDWKEFPWQWWNSDSFWWCAMLVIVVPGLLAYVFGYFAFRSRVKGVYFSIITQALTFAAMLLFFATRRGSAANNGFTDFRRVLDIPIATAGAHGVVRRHRGGPDRHAAARTLDRDFQIRSHPRRDPRRGGTRDVLRLRHNVLQAVHLDPVGDPLRHRGGALRAAGRDHQPERDVARQLDRDRHWVAVGGRGTLAGAALGAGLVNGAKSFFTQAFPEYWLLFLGLIFIVVTIFFPRAFWACSSGSGSAHDKRSGTSGGIGGGRARRQSRGARRPRPHARRRPVSGGHQRQLRRLQGAEQSVAVDRRGRAALRDRSQRRRQDHDDGRHHRKTRPDAGTAFFGQTIDLTRLSEAQIAHAGIGRKFQKPTIFVRHTVFENLECR